MQLSNNAQANVLSFIYLSFILDISNNHILINLCVFITFICIEYIFYRHHRKFNELQLLYISLQSILSTGLELKLARRFFTDLVSILINRISKTRH